ncbi:hypothetical protein [Tautonia rosea]|uniref:hypothetical protein n=1 Tax=Tautonia rosea TaxID=2728037 RepID=UPI0014747CC6|nr:hypothetical protein [Tautonia rosea]
MCRSSTVVVLQLLFLTLGSEVGPTARAQFGRGSAATVLAEQLVAESDRFVEEVRYELAGTRQGRNLEIRGNALRGAAESFYNELLQRHADDSRRLRAFDGVERALTEVQRELNRPPGTAPSANASARRMDRMVAELRREYGGAPLPPGGITPGRPPVSPPSAPGYDWRLVADVSERTLASVQVLGSRIDQEIGRFPPYDGVLRDLDGMASGLSRVNEFARRQLLISQLGPLLAPIQNQARHTAAVLQGARPPVRIARAWNDVQRGIDDLSRLLGVGGDFIIDPNQPVIIDRPGYDQLPWPGPPGWGGGGGILPPMAQAVPFIDEAIREVDAYLLGIRPNVSIIPEGPQFHRDAQELRNALLGLRQGLAAGGWNPSVGRQHREAEAIAQRLVDRTLRVGRGQIGPNNARVLRIQDLINQARAALSGSTPY